MTVDMKEKGNVCFEHNMFWGTWPDTSKVAAACETCMVYLVEAAKGLSVEAAEMEGGLFVPTEVNGANLSDIVVFLWGILPGILPLQLS